MEIETLKQHWEAFGREDPLWAILTDASRRGRRWDLDEFLHYGEQEIATYLGELDQLGVEYEKGRALDFGCGVGRLTQALAERFKRVDGVDIAQPMVDEGRRINRHGDRVRYHVNDAPNLALFPSSTFDFVLSFIVLQHMEPRYAKAYIAEFVRVLRPGGVAVFQVPSHPSSAPPEALAEGAWRAAISLESERPRVLRAGTPLALRVRVRNAGSSTWPAHSLVRLGNHWLDQSGRLLVMDDARADLPSDVAPGEEVTLELTVTAPYLSGRVRLDLDMVQEQVGWFASRGSKPLRIPLTIEASGEEVPEAEEAEAPRMEMHPVPRDEVIATVAAAGGEVLHVIPDISAGAAFVGYRYVVRRASETDPPPPRQSLEHLNAAVAAIPERWDMFPAVISRRPGRAGDLELLFKRALARGLRWLTWAQTEYDHTVRRALAEAQSVLAEQQAELESLRAQLAKLRERRDQRPPGDE